jgi:hypothetical protein
MEMREQETPQVADVAGGAVDGVMQRSLVTVFREKLKRLSWKAWQ